MGLGFDFTFSLMNFMVPVIFLVVNALFVVVIVRGLTQWHRNNQSPRLTVDAQVVGRRSEVSTTHHPAGDNGMAHTHTSTSYYVTFQVESGDRMEFLIPGAEYGMLIQGDCGRLTFQGTRYLGFERG